MRLLIKADAAQSTFGEALYRTVSREATESKSEAALRTPKVWSILNAINARLVQLQPTTLPPVCDVRRATLASAPNTTTVSPCLLLNDQLRQSGLETCHLQAELLCAVSRL